MNQKTKETKLSDVYQQVINFNHARGWHPLPLDDIAKSIIIEAAELLELFQWSSSSKKSDISQDLEKLKKIRHELADVLWYCFTFCYEAGIDPGTALAEKLDHNEEKYPVEKFNGHHNDEFYKAQKAKYRENRK